MKASFGHVEIPARDTDRLGAFFARVFGWSVSPAEWEGGAYLELRSPNLSGAPAQGGILDAAAAGFEHPLPVIHLSEGSIEECLALVEDAGGSVAESPKEIGEMGVFARFLDPEGHPWGLWKKSE